MENENEQINIIAEDNSEAAESAEAVAEELNTEVESSTEEGIAGVAGQFGLKGDIFIAQLVNFLIVLVVLWVFLYKPVVKFLDERQEKIEKSVKQANEIEERIKNIGQEKDSIILEAKKEAAKIAEIAKADSEKRSEEMISSAKREVERVISRGKLQLNEEKAEMLRELKRDIVEIAVSAATRITKEVVDEKKSKSLAEEVVRKMT